MIPPRIDHVPTAVDYNALVDALRSQQLTQVPQGLDLRRDSAGTAVLGLIPGKNQPGMDIDPLRVVTGIVWNSTLHRLDVSYSDLTVVAGIVTEQVNATTYITFVECEAPA